MKVISDNTYNNIRLYLKDDGFKTFDISDVRQNVFRSTTDKEYIVYEFNLVIIGISYSYRIQSYKIDNYGLKKSRKFELEFAEHLGKDYGVLTNSGSSANLLMVSALKSKKLKKLAVIIVSIN